MCCKEQYTWLIGTWFTLFGTFVYAANKMSGNILVVYPPGGQMENYISGGSLAVCKEIT